MIRAVLTTLFEDVSNIEVKYRRIEEENTRLTEELKSSQSQNRRTRERVNLDIEDNENRLRQSERSLRDTENRLNESQNENDRLHDKLQGTHGYWLHFVTFRFCLKFFVGFAFEVNSLIWLIDTTCL